MPGKFYRGLVLCGEMWVGGLEQWSAEKIRLLHRLVFQMTLALLVEN